MTGAERIIGAVISLGMCLDLLDFQNLQFIKESYEILSSAATKLPKNRLTKEKDLLLRELDCAVIETLHTIRRENNLPAFDSVRGVFWEGGELYPNAGFREKDHIQICIRNPNCIKGLFLPRNFDSTFSKV